MQLDEFAEVIKKLEKDIDQRRIMELYKEALSFGEGKDGIIDAIEPEIMVKLIMSYKIGGYGKEFFSNYLGRKKKVWLVGK